MSAVQAIMAMAAISLRMKTSLLLVDRNPMKLNSDETCCVTNKRAGNDADAAGSVRPGRRLPAKQPVFQWFEHACFEQQHHRDQQCRPGKDLVALHQIRGLPEPIADAVGRTQRLCHE